MSRASKRAGPRASKAVKRAHKRTRAGLTLVEACAVLSISGVLVAAFVPSFARHLRFSKIAEATEQLDNLYRSSAAYYATDRDGVSGLLRGCLPESAGPSPLTPSIDPQYVDFTSIDVTGRETWSALGLSNGHHRYSYEIVVAEPGCAPRTSPRYPAVVLRAQGDLDGDGQRSLLERSAAISPDQRSLLPIIPLRIVDRVE
jgi:type II secretory pathway pseudopilin PulG